MTKALVSAGQFARPWLPAVERLERLWDGLDADVQQLRAADDQTRTARGEAALTEAEDRLIALIRRMTEAGLFGRLEQCADLEDRVTPADYITADDQVSRHHVAIMLGEFIGSFVVDNVREPKMYARLLVQDVLACQPDYVALESTCRRLRRTMKFVPAISEVLSVLGEETKAWRKRASAWALAGYWDLRAEDIAADRLDRAAARASAEAHLLEIADAALADYGATVFCRRFGYGQVLAARAHPDGPGHVVFLSVLFADATHDIRTDEVEEEF